MRLILTLALRRIALSLAVAPCILAACANSHPGSASTPVTVVASFYPLAEVARQVGGSRVVVTNLTPPGAEPHDLELSPSQVAAVEDARLVVVLGRGFQPSVERAAKKSRDALAVLDGVSRPSGVSSDDAHLWLDPVAMQTIVDKVRDALTRLDRPGRSSYEASAARYRQILSQLDGRYRTGLAQCQRREIVTSHAAFGWLSARYRLTQLGITGFNPEAEPTPVQLSTLADLIRRDHVTTVFTERLLSPKAANALAREAHVATAVLDPIEGLAQTQQAKGESYVPLMDENLAKLRLALGCS